MKTLFTNGEIWCSRGTYTNAILVESGKVVAIGHDALQASNDEVIDLTGKFMAPGFIDAHAHPLFAGRESQGPNVNGLKSVAEILTLTGKTSLLGDQAVLARNASWPIATTLPDSTRIALV